MRKSKPFVRAFSIWRRRIVRGSYGHSSPSTWMSQAKRATVGSQGTGVKLARSGIAAMSGSLGNWPISPAANPAKPAPSDDEVVEICCRHELRARPRVHVHELREVELDSALLDSLRMSSTVGAAASAMRLPPSLRVGEAEITGPDAPADGCSLQALGGGYVGFRPSQSLLEPHHLHRDLDHEPVVLAQVEAGELLDAPKALAERVRMDVQRLGGRADVAAPAQELLEGAKERCLPLAVVVGDASRSGRAGRRGRRVERHAQEVLVRRRAPRRS